jgi:hypothetical protein
MSEEQRFDPRFNPAFQRGFDVSTDRVRRANVTPSLTAEDVMYGRSARPDFAAPPPPPPEETEDQVTPPVEVPSPVSPRDRHNPFLWTLWLLGVGFAGGGIALLIGPIRMMYSNSFNLEQSNVAVLQVLYVASPALITVGLGTISGLLFWHAAAWKARRRLG